MSKAWRASRARDAVSELRRRLHAYGCTLDPVHAVDPAALAEAYLDCQVVFLADLTDRRAMEYLEDEWGLDTTGEAIDDAPQAGGLYVAEGGTHRWIFVESGDSPVRQRWTVAHEIGHLVREALPRLEHDAAAIGELLADVPARRLLKYGRCTERRDDKLTRAGKLELDAHDFAAELLMPTEGVRALLRQHFPSGIASEHMIPDLVRLLVSTYHVSWEAADRRVSDLEIRPYGAGPNGDLFAGA